MLLRRRVAVHTDESADPACALRCAGFGLF
jgi:hypothetical protein